MPDQYLIKEPETPDGGIETFLSLCRVERGGIDTFHVIPERVMKSPYYINRFCHMNSQSSCLRLYLFPG
jgi:hypothetical protein